MSMYLVLINIVSFMLFGLDKYYARHDKWRILERQLLLVTAIGGSAGSLIGMYIFHHKTRKQKFQILVPVFCILHIALLAYMQ